ncbi:MAG: hypothetical protein ACTFAL_11775 [Candidatus Electronema sp. V4]|uniref:hypothetical protein n=1 Tax=Candidatus Electronema sp. V4 TaxID=3454756 RepID=UPI0040554765
MKILEEDEQLYNELKLINEKMRRSDAGIILLSEINSDDFFEKNENDIHQYMRFLLYSKR